MKNRSRNAAKVTGIVAAGALVFGVMGPAGAASQAVSYALVPTTGTITLPTATDPVVLTLPDATGVTGTYDDVTGAFTGTFSSAEYGSSREAAPGVVANQRSQILAPGGVSGTIDPATGLGTISATFNANITVDSITVTASNTTSRVNVVCTITTIPVTYNVTATKVPADSLNFTNLSLVSAAPFTVPAAVCENGPGEPGVLPVATVQAGINTALALPNPNATSALQMVAGAVPPPPVTTTTTIPPTTTTSTTAPSGEEEAPAAGAVVAQVRFTG